MALGTTELPKYQSDTKGQLIEIILEKKSGLQIIRTVVKNREEEDLIIQSLEQEGEIIREVLRLTPKLKAGLEAYYHGLSQDMIEDLQEAVPV